MKASPAKSTPRSALWSAMLPGVWPGACTTRKPPSDHPQGG
jgi:hypothetical protein